MKKLICFIFSLVLVMGLTASAMADVPQKTISLNVQCVNTTDLSYDDLYNVVCAVSGRMYVYHYATDGSNEYTNLVHVTKPYRWLCAQKWCTPYLDVPVQANTLIKNTEYSCAARGNTKHYELDGVTRVTLSIRLAGK